MANETHNGNLNRSQEPAHDKFEGTYGGKSNDSEATLRKGRLPKSEAVRTASVDEHVACKCADKQNQNDGDENSRAVIPNDRIPAPPTHHK